MFVHCICSLVRIMYLILWSVLLESVITMCNLYLADRFTILCIKLNMLHTTVHFPDGKDTTDSCQ